MRFELGLVLILFMVALAGCVTGETKEVPPTPSAGPAEFGDTTGAIEGVVVDDSLVPIADATVGIQGLPEFVTQTDAQGAFSFSHVPPGRQVVLAQRIGFGSGMSAIEVPAGAVATAQIVLSPVPVDLPYFQTQEQRGMFGCGSSWRPSLGVPGVVTVGGIAVCGVFSLVLNDTTYDHFLLLWETSGNDTASLEAGVFEMEWTSNQAFGNGMAVYWEVDGCSNNRTARFALERGESPLRARLAGAELDERLSNITTYGCDTDECAEGECEPCNDEKCMLQSRVFSDPDTLGASSPADVGITFQQTFTQYFTEFYHDEGPAEFTALEDT